MSPETKFAILLTILNIAAMLVLGWLIVNFICSGHCGGTQMPGVPWGPP